MAVLIVNHLAFLTIKKSHRQMWPRRSLFGEYFVSLNGCLWLKKKNSPHKPCCVFHHSHLREEIQRKTTRIGIVVTWGDGSINVSVPSLASRPMMQLTCHNLHVGTIKEFYEES